MKQSNRVLISLLLALSLILIPLLTGCSGQAIDDIIRLIADPEEAGFETAEPSSSRPAGQETGSSAGEVSTEGKDVLTEDGWYYSPEDVSLYLHTYGKLPSNYLTKQEAQQRGWDSSAGNLWSVAEGYCIGGDRFGNYEGKLPKNNGTYYECDVNYSGGFRGAERLIFTKDGQIWYTGDHYNTFQKLY